MQPVRSGALALLTVGVLVIGACMAEPGSRSPNATAPAGSPAVGGSVTVYSGRSEELVGPLLERFEEATGTSVEVRYGDTAELAALILDEGANSPADVYFAQDAGALGALSEVGLLAELPQELLDRVSGPFRSPAGEWVGVSGRARVLAYDSRELSEDDLPQSVDELTDPAWRGRIGWAPTNGSFQAFVTAYRQLRGEDAARTWLEGMLANEPRVYEGNTPIVQAVADTEIDLGLVNHYYALRARAEQGDEFPVLNHFLSGDDPGALVNVAGAAVLASSTQASAAHELIAYLLNEESQAYFAEETFEYPLVDGVDAPAGAPPLEQLQVPDLDLSDLADLEGTLRLLQEVGALP
ncbi:MAG TPA: iron ABC transporter substrate-binding protein [Candidatus Limnocylindria bacterium]|nr:iron ABC transporter substrate-binding protein [Candidatus Limnocylindria bacterium]